MALNCTARALAKAQARTLRAASALTSRISAFTPTSVAPRTIAFPQRRFSQAIVASAAEVAGESISCANLSL